MGSDDRTAPPRRAIVAVGAARGGVAGVFRRVVVELRERGHDVQVIDVLARRTPAAAGIAAARSARGALKAASTVHLEFGSNDTETFWFAVFAVLMRSDCVVIAHDYPKVINAPAAGLLRPTSRLRSAFAYRVLCPLLDPLLVRILLRRAGVVVVFGEEARQGWLDRGARCVAVIRLGGEPATDGNPPPSKGDSVLFAGFLGPSKGIDTLLHAWTLISDMTDLPLIVAGGAGPPHDVWIAGLRQRFSHLPNAPQFIGHVPQEHDLQRLIGRAAVVALPYRYSSPASGVLVRAMSAGRPVVATPVPAACAAIEDGENGLLVPIDNVDALAEAILWLCQSPAERDRLGAAAAGSALRLFTWKSHIDGLERAYATAVRG